MPSERDLRRRVRSVKNIQQLTRAMQLVAASKMRRAQEAVLASRPFEQKLRSVLNELAPYADPELSPLLRARTPMRKVAVVLITTDRGLVGPMNVNLVRTALRFAQTQPDTAYVAVDEFVNGNVDEVHLGFTRFINTLRQEPTIRRILPLVPEDEDIDDLPPIQYLFEPDPQTVMEVILPRFIEMAVYQAILE